MQIASSGASTVTAPWTTATTAGVHHLSSLFLRAPPTPWPTSWRFMGSRGSRSPPALQLSNLYRSRRRGTFQWAWQGSAAARAAPKTISDVCVEAGWGCVGVGDGQLCKVIALLILFLKIVLYVTISASLRIKFVYCSSYEKPCHICTDSNQHQLKCQWISRICYIWQTHGERVPVI